MALENEPGNESAIDNLHEALGFIETQEMVDIKSQLIQAMAENDQKLVVELLNQYQDLGDAIVDAHENSLERIKAQLGQALALTLARRDAGRIESYIEDLDEIWEATDLPEDFILILRRELSRARAELDARQ